MARKEKLLRNLHCTWDKRAACVDLYEPVPLENGVPTTQEESYAPLNLN